MMPRLLIVDDDQPTRQLVERLFSREGFEVLGAPDGPLGLEAVSSRKPDVVLLDLGLPGTHGLEVLERLQASAPWLPVVMLTGSHDVTDAVRAMKLGAFDYLSKPMNREEVVLVVRRALETRALRREVQELRRQASGDGRESLAALMGPSDQVSAVIQAVDVVASSNFTVLILGETGTGKELVAQALHRVSDRRSRPLIALDCGAIPEALLESELFGHERGAFTGAERRREGRLRLADGGTCFLDELGNLPLQLQPKLLRVLESGQVLAVGAERSRPLDVRFIAATNDDLQARVAEGRFRADLYFRLAQYTITLPALRDRAEDIPYLTQRFIGEASLELRRPVQALTPDALELLRQHRWPGNVRELRNVVRQAVLHTTGLAVRAQAVRAALSQVSDTGLGEPPESRAGSPEASLREIAARAADAAEHRAICATLVTTAGNKSQAARLLETDYKTLHLKMKHLGIRARDFAP